MMESTGSVSAPDKLWRTFVEHALIAVKLAALHIRQDHIRLLNEADDGWFGAMRISGPLPHRRIPQENAITEALRDVLESWAASMAVTDQPPDEAPPGLPDISRMHFAIEQPPARIKTRRVPRGVGRHAPRTDLAIAVRTKADLDLRLEAKILLSDSEISTRYLGLGGAGRFDDAEVPYTLKPWGGMLAYVVDRTQDEWTRTINAEIERSLGPRRGTFDLAGQTHTTTRHDLPPLPETPSVVEVVHLVVEVETDPTSRP